jgi:hypothetical protein
MSSARIAGEVELIMKGKNVRLTIDQLPPGLRQQAEKQLSMRVTKHVAPDIITATPKRKMTKTEQSYEQILVTAYERKNVHFEGLSLRLRNGLRYTPDFVAVAADESICLYEVKGSYRLHSYSRARMAFLQARIDWPMFGFVWIEKQKDGSFLRKENP